jgi:hypothetical protein
MMRHSGPGPWRLSRHRYTGGAGVRLSLALLLVATSAGLMLAIASASAQADARAPQVPRTQNTLNELSQSGAHGQPSRAPAMPATAQARPPRPVAKPAPKPAAPKVERPVPFVLGETLAYDISWSTFLTAATATVSVKEKRPSYDSLAYYIVAEGQPTALVAALYKLYYKADTLLDAYTLLPQRGSLYSREAGRQHLRATRFLQEARKAEYEVQSGATLSNIDTHLDLPMPAATQDALSAIYALRAMELKPGASLILPVSINGAVYRVRVVAGNKEPVTCGLGTLTAWKLTPSLLDAQDEPEAQNMAIWISDDRRRLPLLMQADFPVGTFKLTLRSATGS